MAVVKTINSRANVATVINYITKEEKNEGIYTRGINCNPDNATQEFLTVKELYGKKDGRQYQHAVFSFPEGEKITPEQALQYAEYLIRKNPAYKGFQTVLSCHVDRDHLHVHAVTNSVSMEDGHKFQFSKNDLSHLKEQANELSRKLGLSVPEKGQNVTDWSHEKHKVLERAFAGTEKSWLLDIANAVADAKEVAISKDDFISRLQSVGIETTWTDERKYITFKSSEGKARNSNLEKTFKIPLGKEVLLDEFFRNAEREETRSRARRQLTDSRADSAGTVSFGQKSHTGIGEAIARAESAYSNRQDRETERERQRIEAERDAQEREQEAERRSKEPAKGHRTQHDDFGR